MPHSNGRLLPGLAKNSPAAGGAGTRPGQRLAGPGSENNALSAVFCSAEATAKTSFCRQRALRPACELHAAGRSSEGCGDFFLKGNLERKKSRAWTILFANDLDFQGVQDHLKPGCTDFWRRHPDLNWRMEVLQTSALPLGYAARIARPGGQPRRPRLCFENQKILERETGFEPATSTLARLHSTTELLPRGKNRRFNRIGRNCQGVRQEKMRSRKQRRAQAPKRPGPRRRTAQKAVDKPVAYALIYCCRQNTCRQG